MSFLSLAYYLCEIRSLIKAETYSKTKGVQKQAIRSLVKAETYSKKGGSKKGFILCFDILYFK